MGKRDSLSMIVKRFPACIEVRDSCGRTPLLVACARNSRECVQLLLERGASVYACDLESGWTCFHYSLYYGCLNIFKILMDYIGHDLDRLYTLVDRNGYTPFDLFRDNFKDTKHSAEDSSSPLILRPGTFVSSFGDSSNYQLGYPVSHSRQSRPKIIKTLNHLNVSGFDVGRFASACIDEIGDIYTWGVSKRGLLGQGTNHSDTCMLPGKINSLATFVQVAVGETHMVAITDEGKVFSWGFGALGHSYSTMPNKQYEKISFIPKLIEGLKNVRIVHVSACKDNTVLVSHTGTIYLLGKSFEEDHVYVHPEEIFTFKYEGVVQIRVSPSSLLVLSSIGRVLEFHSDERRFKPIEFPSSRFDNIGYTVLRRFIHIQSCEGFSMAITNHGDVFLWIDDNRPIRLKRPHDCMFIQGCCSQEKVTAVSSEGDVYEWNLKHKDYSVRDLLTNKRKFLYHLKPQRIYTLTRAVQVLESHNCTIVLQSLWTFEKNTLASGCIPPLLEMCENRLVEDMDLKKALNLFKLACIMRSSNLLNYVGLYIAKNLQHFLNFLFAKLEQEELSQLFPFISELCQSLPSVSDQFDEIDCKFYSSISISVPASPVSARKTPGSRKKHAKKFKMKKGDHVKALFGKPENAVEKELFAGKPDPTVIKNETVVIKNRPAENARQSIELKPSMKVPSMKPVQMQHFPSLFAKPSKKVEKNSQRNCTLSDFIPFAEKGQPGKVWGKVSSSSKSLAQIQREEKSLPSSSQPSTCWGLSKSMHSLSLSEIQNEQTRIPGASSPNCHRNEGSLPNTPRKPRARPKPNQRRTTHQ